MYDTAITESFSMSRETSERHTELLNNFMEGTSAFSQWVQEKLGDLTISEWGWGHVSMHWNIDDNFIMPDGVMFGGHIAAVADHLVALGAMTVLSDSKERFRTSRLETNFFRPLKAPHADIEVRVTNASNRLIHVEADIVDSHDKLAVRVNAVQVRRLTG